MGTKGKGWHNDSRRHALARKKVVLREKTDGRYGRVKSYQPLSRGKHKFAEELPFWSEKEILKFENEFGEIQNVKEGFSGRKEYIIETDEGEFRVFEDYDSAYNTCVEELSNMWESDPYTFPVDWVVQDNIFISDTDRGIIANEEVDFRLQDMHDEDILEEADMKDDYDKYYEDIIAQQEREEEIEDILYRSSSENVDREQLEDELYAIRNGMEELRARQEDLIDKARDKLTMEIYDEWYEGLKHPMQFLVEDIGMYTKEQLMEANFVRIDYDGMAEDVIKYDGVGHILSHYDGTEHELGDAYIYKIDG